MRSSPTQSRCPVCRAEVAPGLKFCGTCGAQLAETPAREILSVNYLLAELSRWEAEGIVGAELASELRANYERRREELRAQLNGKRAQPSSPSPPGARTSRQQQTQQQQQQTSANYPPGRSAPEAEAYFPPPVAPLRMDFPPRSRAPRRPLLETLADPQTIRLLLYTGAGMLVVGVVIWLRDVLYLKLQEPIVQAALLAIGTIGITVAGWLTILRTRLRLTGRALTLTGSLLVPVNFWFLVRSGLVRDNGRAWVVCAICALLYAHTAALLREKLYVYLASVAAIATAWTIIYRVEPEAFGLYALALMSLSLVFLHLSRLFPIGDDDERLPIDDERRTADNSPSAIRHPPSALGDELWSPPLVHVALAGAALSLLFYMPLRLGTSPSLANGILRLRASEYDPGVAMLLFAMGAYAAWFTGRYIYTDRRLLLYTTSALALFWTEFLAADALGLSNSVQLLLLAATACVVALAARLTRGEELALSLHRASLIVSGALAAIAYAVISSAPSMTLTHSATLIFLAASYAALSAPRFCERVAGATLAHASAIFASAAFLVALDSFHLQSETLFYAACSLGPFALYAIARLTAHLRRETQLSVPFRRIADAEYVLLLAFAIVVAFVLDQAPEDRFLLVENLRGAMFCAASAAAIYGAVRCWRERSVFGAALMSTALLVLVAATGDALKFVNALPSSWPVATAVIIAAFLMREAAERLLRSDNRAAAGENPLSANFAASLTRAGVIRLVADCAVLACAALWFMTALSRLSEGGTSAPAVLLLALLYWTERAARLRQSWPVHLSTAHAAALCLALLIALRVDAQWFACLSVLVLFPLFFATGRYARAHNIDWLAQPASVAAGTVAALAAFVSLAQAVRHLNVGEPLLLAPSVALGAVALLSFGASLWSESPARVRYFRAGLSALVVAFALAALRAGFDPLRDAEIYTTPVGLLLLVVAYLAVRRDWEDYAADTTFLLWAGSLLVAAPLVLHALEYRLLLDMPALWRDVATLCASLALILFGVMGRLRAPLLVGASALVLELTALALTSVDWLQIPLKVYLMTVGALILLIWGLLEFRREQILLMRRRFNERREEARERFGEWR